MLTRDPDVTRLLDRLECGGLISWARGRSTGGSCGRGSRRRARQALAKLDGPVLELHRRQLGHLGAGRLRSLGELLRAARERTSRHDRRIIVVVTINVMTY